MNDKPSKTGRMKASVPTSQAPEAELRGVSLSPLVPGDYHRVMRARAWHGMSRAEQRQDKTRERRQSLVFSLTAVRARRGRVTKQAQVGVEAADGVAPWLGGCRCKAEKQAAKLSVSLGVPGTALSGRFMPTKLDGRIGSTNNIDRLL